MNQFNSTYHDQEYDEKMIYLYQQIDQVVIMPIDILVHYFPHIGVLICFDTLHFTSDFPFTLDSIILLSILFSLLFLFFHLSLIIIIILFNHIV